MEKQRHQEMLRFSTRKGMDLCKNVREAQRYPGPYLGKSHPVFKNQGTTNKTFNNDFLSCTYDKIEAWGKIPLKRRLIGKNDEMIIACEYVLTGS